MPKIEYEIKLNESGRPCIELSEDYVDKPEDKFFAIELARYFLQAIHSRMTSPPYDEHTINTADIAIRLLGQIGDEMAEIQWNNMKTMGEFDMMLNKWYHITVPTIEELKKVGEYTVENNKLYKLQEGLKAFVVENMTVYEFKNENWSEINEKLEENIDESQANA